MPKPLVEINGPIHPRIRHSLEFVALLESVARATLRDAAAARHRRTRRRRGGTLRPGSDTPLWNELARNAAVQLRRHGDKVKLARELGLPRQTLHRLLVARTASPDAERTLLLLVWLQARLKGRRLG